MRKLLVVGVAAAVAGAGLFVVDSGNDYEVRLVLPSAAQLAVRSPVWINGADAGSVEALEARDGKALVTVLLADDYAPLRDGTTSRVEWSSALGERMLTLYPGPARNAEIPADGLIEAQSRQIEVDQVLAALDKPTRDRLTALLRDLNQTVEGREPDLAATLRGAGASAQALQEVLVAVGRDGPAIRSLVGQLHQVTSVAAGRRDQVSDVVTNLTALTGSVAGQQRQLSDSLAELPSTLDAAKRTLDKLPAAGDATTNLLHDLAPAAARLPSVAGNLGPLLTDLRPAVADLRPLLGSAQTLLRATPGLLDTSHQVLPQATQLLHGVAPAVAFLRPYTPEGVGMLHNWGQSFAPYDGAGHVWAGLLAPGTNLVNESVVQPPGSRRNPEPLPGQPVDQPWVDATGSGMR